MAFGFYLFGRSSWNGPLPGARLLSFPRSQTLFASQSQPLVFTGYCGGAQVALEGEGLDGTGAELAAPLSLNGQIYTPLSGRMALQSGFVAEDISSGICHFIGHVTIGGVPVGTVISRGWSTACPTRWLPGPQAGARLRPISVTPDVPAGNPFRTSSPSLGEGFAAEDFSPLSTGVSLGRGTLGLIDDPADQPFFAAGTVILTRRGPVPIEELGIGDLVLTVDHGYRPLRWIGRCQLSAEDLALKPDLRPIRIRQGALGPGQPTQDLLVSPQHRILVRSTVVERLFEVREALVAVRHLLFLAGVDPAVELEQVDYYHLMFDSHEVIFSNGAMTETLHSGPEAMTALDPAALAEILSIFPELRSAQGSDLSGRARLFLTGRQGRELAEIHRDLGGPLYA